MSTNAVYLRELSKELRRHSVPEIEIKKTLLEVHATLEDSNLEPEEEFGSPKDYVNALFPERKSQNYSVFTLIGLIIAIIGFIGLNIYFKSIGTVETTEALLRFIPLIAIPIGMAIDFTRYLRA